MQSKKEGRSISYKVLLTDFFLNDTFSFLGLKLSDLKLSDIACFFENLYLTRKV